MKNRSWWIVLCLGVALIGGVLLLAPPWATRKPLEGPPTMPAVPDNTRVNLATPEAADTSEMLKMARAAFLACGAPAAPTDMPDGRTATREQMAAAHATVKAFDEATSIYNQCLDTTAYQAAVQYRSVATSADTEALNSLQIRLHNDAIDLDQNLANRFNVQLRIFKARGNK